MGLGAKYSPSFLSSYHAIHRHLKCKADLYSYFLQGRRALMPGLQACDSEFLLQLLAGDKLLLTKPETLPSRESVENCSLSRKKLVKLCSVHPVISNYLPENSSKVPAEHLCCLIYALDPELYASQVKGQSISKPVVHYKKHKCRSIRREFAQILLKMQASGEGKEDFLSTGKSSVVETTQSTA